MISHSAGETAGPGLDLAAHFPKPAREDWRRLAEGDLDGAEFDKKLVWKTFDGISVQPMYFADDVVPGPSLNSNPGHAPYRRGTQSRPQDRAPWQIRQDCMLASPEEANAALHDDLGRGATAIAIRLDNAARQGIDGDDPRAAGLAGRGGCTLSSINGLRIALAAIDFNRVPITLRTGTAALPALAMLVALARERGVDPRVLTGAVEGDPFRELVKNGFMRGSFALRFAELVAMAKWCAANAPGIRPVMVNSSPVHNAGASGVQEAAYVLAVGAEYMRALTAAGMSPDKAALSMTASVSVSPDLFLEIARLRAARMTWTRMMRAFGTTEPQAERLFCHVRTSSRAASAIDPYNNMIRSTIEAFAAAVGGCDSMYVAPFDEVVGRPDEFSSRIARNQQLILQLEAHLGDVEDPAGGSYCIEALTDAFARESWAIFARIENEGGLAKSLAAGSFQKIVGETAKKRAEMVAQRRLPIVGVSNYADPAEQPLEKSHIPREEFLAERRKRIGRLKALRDAAAVGRTLERMVDCAASGEDLMEAAIAAAEQGATIGEMTAALVACDAGNPVRVAALERARASEPFERLRRRSRERAERLGSAPRVILLPLGPVGMRRVRADFCFGFLAAGGLDIVDGGGFKTPVDAVAKAVESGAFLAVLCSDDASYPELAKTVVPALKSARPDVLVYVAGYPTDAIETLKAAGVDGFIHVRANVLDELSALHDKQAKLDEAKRGNR